METTANQRENKRESVIELKQPEVVSEFKVVYDRELCVAAGPCFACHPDMWGHDAEFKAVLKDSHRNKVRQVNEHTWERDLDESELETGKDSVEICPVDAIRLVKKNLDKEK